jgi:hypothetical protein
MKYQDYYSEPGQPKWETVFEDIGSLDEEGLSYAWHTLGVFQHKETGKVYYDCSGGCSCNSFGDDLYYNDESDHNLTEVSVSSYEDFRQEVFEFPDTLEAREKLLRAVKAALKHTRVEEL